MNFQNITSEIFQRLEISWNESNGKDFGKEFSDNCDFVDITGTLHPGQCSSDIGKAHQQLFETIYYNSKIKYDVLQTSEINHNALITNVRAFLESPSGPLKGTTKSTITALIINVNGKWLIRAFHNTLMRDR